jgi:cytidylate kinase
MGMKNHAKAPAIIAIDGPAGVGKSTVGRKVAGRLGAIFVSSGLVYRATAWGLTRDGISVARPDKVLQWMDSHRVTLVPCGGEARVHVDGDDVTERLHTPEISEEASRVAAIAGVRERLLKVQRHIAEDEAVVMEGRDIGTAVFPNADFKFFLDADEGARAERRYRELLEKGFAQEHPLVKEALKARDELDSTRSASPLLKAADAVRIDSTHMTLDEVVDAVMHLIDSREARK